MGTRAMLAFFVVLLFSGMAMGQAPAVRATPDLNGRWRTEEAAPNKNAIWKEIEFLHKGTHLRATLSMELYGKPRSIKARFYTDGHVDDLGRYGDPGKVEFVRSHFENDVLVIESYTEQKSETSTPGAASGITILSRTEISLYDNHQALKIKTCPYFADALFGGESGPCREAVYKRQK